MHLIRGDEIEYVPASHEDPNDPGVLKKVLATKQQLIGGRVQMLNWSRLPVGKSFQPHYHEDMQEVFVLLNGRVRMTVSESEHELGKGDAILVAPREIHEMTNICDQAVEYIVFGISTEEGGKTVNV